MDLIRYIRALGSHFLSSVLLTSMFYMCVVLPTCVARSHAPSPELQAHQGRHPTCALGNRTYLGGEKFRPGPCVYCRCPQQGGRARCVIKDCLQEPGCIRYHHEPGWCCGSCLEMGCRLPDGQTVSAGAVVRSTPCETCQCPEDGGLVVCQKHPCQITDSDSAERARSP